MSVTVTISCETLGCTASITRETSNITTLRSALRVHGWITQRWEADSYPRVRFSDHCPACATDFSHRVLVAERVPYEQCGLGPACPSRNPRTREYRPLATDVYDWWGHDRLGHRAGRIAVRHNLYPLPAMLGVPLRAWLDLPGFGSAAADRWKVFTASPWGTRAGKGSAHE